INTDVSANTLVAYFTNIDFEGTHTASEIAGFHVMLTDGDQYTQPVDTTWYDYRSISACRLF
ncbi:MAG TPA: hypothetical protein VLH81_05910, partial [Desulfobacterales bacterium]|nr:hypothetical protein [Desulfobacterales bacterium]